MLTSTLVLGLLLPLTAAGQPQLLVTADADPRACRPAPEAWSSSAPSETASAEAVRHDLEGYFGGLSAQFTPVLDAAWHGTVRFCTPAGESLVLNALAELVIRPPVAEPHDGKDLPAGAERLLVAFASPALVASLEAIEPETDPESARRATALAVVREAQNRVDPKGDRR